MINTLKKYSLYCREQVCSILAPTAVFTPKSGTWGLHGLIRINPGESNFVLFLTVGASQAGYKFIETVNEIGEFDWYSQPSLKLKDKIVEELIENYDGINQVHAFFRPNTIKKEYVYLGRIKYICHNPSKEMPVQFKWKVLDWNNSEFNKSLLFYCKSTEQQKSTFDNYLNKNIEDLKLSVRLYNCLKKNNINTVYELLKLDKEELLTFKNLGVKTYNEAIHLIGMYRTGKVSEYTVAEMNKSWQDELGLSLRARNVLKKNGVGKGIDLASLTKDEINKFEHCGVKTVSEINAAIKILLTTNVKTRAEYLKLLINKINVEYFELIVEDVFSLTLSNELKNASLFLIKDIISAPIEKLEKLKYNLNNFECQLSVLEKPLKEVIVFELVEVLKNKSKKGNEDSMWMRNAEILNNRADGKTLEESGARYSLTRERVRQLEKKYLSRAKIFCNSNHVKLFLKSKFINQSYLFETYFSGVLNELSDLFLFTLLNNDVDDFYYVDEYKVLIVGENWYEDVNSLFELFPETIKIEDVCSYKDLIVNQLKKAGVEMLSQDVDKIFEIEYVKNGEIYSKTVMSAIAKINNILQTHFNDGMDVYDVKSLKKFREVYSRTFEGEELSLNDRALTSRLIGKCVLIDRGIYAPKQDKYMKDSLIKKIDEFIQSQQRGIISFNHMFLIFEEELKECRINNRYYLQGALKEIFKGKYFTRRDYLTKTKEEFSYYDEVINFIIESEIPLSKLDLKNEFPGISDIVITVATSNPEILNLFGSYLHISKVDIYDEEISILKQAIERLLIDKKPHNVLEIMETTSAVLKHLYARTGIDSKSKVYSLLHALFYDEFQFKRPFVAAYGVDIQSGKEMLEEFIYSFDEVAIEEIQDFAKENNILIYSIVELIDSLNTTYIFKDRYSVVSAERLMIGKTLLNITREIIDEELAHKDYVEIKQIQGLYKLPKISLPWNEWILYSIIKKYLHEFSVYTSDGQFRHATPVVCKKELDVCFIRSAVGRIRPSQSSGQISFGEVDIDKEFSESFDFADLEEEEQ